MSSRPLAAATLALIALLVTATGALGHADLIAANPPDGGTLTSTPHTLTLMFDEPLAQNSSVVVRDSSGAEVASGGVSETNEAVLTAELPALSPGEYVARWTASSDDGHAERGTVTFSVAESAATPSPTPMPEGGGATGGSDLLIALLLAAVAIAAVVGFLLMRGRR